MSDDEKPEGCDCCGFETTDLDVYPRDNPSPENKTKWLCAFCSSTPTGVRYEYKQHLADVDATDILKTVCYIGNVLLEKIEKLR